MPFQTARHSFLTVLVLLGLAAAPGCRKASPGGEGQGGAKTYKFAFLTNNSSDFWNIAEKGVHAAEKDLGIKAVVFRPLKMEVAEQQRYIEDILVQDYDGMAVCAINPDSETPILNRVADKMPLVMHDSDAPKSKRKAFVGTDNVEAGKLAGQTAIAALKAANITTGKVAMFVGRIDMQNAVDRKRGIDETLGKQTGIEILPVFLDGADRNKAKKNVEDALARYPDLVMTIGLWSYNGPCMVDAVRSSPRARKPLIVAFDEEEETLKGIQDGTIYATIVQRPFQIGYQTMKALKDLRDGKTIPTFIDTTIKKIDQGNLTAFWTELRELKK
jgi:ribose transport system substrate-binding protein